MQLISHRRRNQGPALAGRTDGVIPVTLKNSNRHTRPASRGANARHDQASSIATRTHLNTDSARTRHTWVTHLTEDGVDRRFIQEAVGHRCDTSTAIYTHVSGDFMNTALRKALAPALDVQPG
jgi:site-specific recombinase XerD